jgi:hypothetical protein
MGLAFGQVRRHRPDHWVRDRVDAEFFARLPHDRLPRQLGVDMTAG